MAQTCRKNVSFQKDSRYVIKLKKRFQEFDDGGGMRTTFIYGCFMLLMLACGELKGQSPAEEKPMFQSLTFDQADKKAEAVVASMTLEEKIAMIGGDRSFFIRPVPRLHLQEVFMSDATQGVRIQEGLKADSLSKTRLEKSTAFPCPLLLAATWNPGLSFEYAKAIGEECRAGNINILLGPGMNQYRQSQCGRNFEYFGEDPYLRARMIEQYVTGVQSTGTIATLKHFAANNTDHFRRRSNSIVDERTLHEIYLPGFKAGIDAGAKAVMTSYNQINGEWCGQSAFVIDTLLRKELGFQWLVMTDWSSVYDGEKLIKSGQNLEMPSAFALKNVHELLRENKVQEKDITEMVRSIVRTCFAMKFDERDPMNREPARYDEHEAAALQTAREGIVLLRNEGNILPIKDNVKTILLTGEFVKKLAAGGGSARVRGYDIRLMLDELQSALGDRLRCIKDPGIQEIQSADVVLCNVGTEDSEGSDRPFELPETQEALVQKCVNNNSNTVVIVTSGSGVRMTGWNEKAKAILYAWYVGQIGNKALAEIITGKVNPSGRLPITIEREFRDSPGYGYIPDGDTVHTGRNYKLEAAHPVFDIRYTEGIFSGYRWYDKQNIAPLYPFGFGLSYTTFEYENLAVSQERFRGNGTVHVSITVKNTGNVIGSETVQLYVQDVECTVPRPVKELKGFKKVSLKPGESRTVEMLLQKKDFSFWDTNTKDWKAEQGAFVILAGSSSRDIKLKKEITLE